MNSLFKKGLADKVVGFAIFSFVLFLGSKSSISAATCAANECSQTKVCNGKMYTEYVCGGGSYCCYGNGCPSWDCEDAASNCCWYNNPGTCRTKYSGGCPGAFYGSLCGVGIDGCSECRPCSGSDDGGGTTTGRVLGRIWTDLNGNGVYDGPSEVWGRTDTPTSTCSAASLRNNNFVLNLNSVNKIASWNCNATPAQAYYITSSINTGSNYIFTLGGLPAGYTCDSWSYDTGSGSGCTTTVLTIAQGDVNDLWWKIGPANSPPTVSVVPSVISYYAGGEKYPIKVAYTDSDVGGQITVTTSLPSNLGTIHPTYGFSFTAYANRSSTGVWPIAKIYGWNKTTGERIDLGSVTIDSTTPKDFYFNLTDFNVTYSNFDFEFTNDIWDAATSSGTDIFIDALDYWSDSFGWDPPYTVQAENGTLVQYDRGNSRDGNNVIDPSINVVNNGGRTYTAMYWGGALRFPIIYVSPSTMNSGNMTVTVSDRIAPPVVVNIPINAVPRTLSGRLWLLPEGAIVDSATCTAKAGVGLSATVTANTSVSSYTGTVTNGNYSVPGTLGIFSSVVFSVVNPSASYSVACVNSAPGTATGLTIPGSRVVTQPPPSTSAVLDIGLRVPTAKKWIAATGGDIYANNITMQLSSVPSPCSLSYLCPVLTNPYATPSKYVIGYTSTPSSVFASGAVPSVDYTARLSESNVSATTVGGDFRKKNEQYFKKLKTLLNSVKDSPPSTPINYLTSTTFSTVPGNNSSSIKVFTTNISYLKLTTGPVTYTTASDGLVFLLVPKAQGSDNTLYIDYPLTISSAYPNRRIVIIADRNIKIGANIQGTADNPKTVTPHMMATIITTGDIEVVNYAGAGTPNTVVIEGSLIAGGEVRVSRAQAAVDNELRPTLFVRFKPLYITKFNDLAFNNTIPLLSSLFTFDFSQQEVD